MALVIGIAFLLQNCSKDDSIVQEDPIVQYKLTTDVTPALSGSVSPSSGTYNMGTEISLTATPASEYVFKNWSNGASGTENPLSVIMNSNKNITAVFEKKNYSLNIVIVGEGTVTEEIIQAKSEGDYPSGTIVKLTAVPSAGWFFFGWSGDYEGAENPIQLTINKPTTLTATFAEPSPNKTYVPDDNFEQALINLGYDDVLDNYVYTDIIDKITSLQIPSKAISDLTGIEDFVSLDILHCENNLLTSLDLSNNTKLEFFDCENNLLTSLNVSNLVNLTAFDCPNNQLASIDISDNIKLRELYCPNNKLTSLDISNNPMLGTESPYNFLDCRNNPLLKCIQISEQQLAGIDPLIYFWFKDDTAIYSLDCNISSKTYVPDDNFEQALIDLGYDNVLDDYVNTANIDKIIELYVSDKGIEDLTGIEDFVALTTLVCSNNQLTNLDVSKNIALTVLSCSNNQLSLLDLSKNTKIIWLLCENNQLTSLDVSNLIDLREFVCSHNQLISLDVSNNNFLGVGMGIWLGFNCIDNLLTCIQVNIEQLANIDSGIGYFWTKDDIAIYSLDCNY